MKRSTIGADWGKIPIRTSFIIRLQRNLATDITDEDEHLYISPVLPKTGRSPSHTPLLSL